MRILRSLAIGTLLALASAVPAFAQGSVIATCASLALPVRSGQPLFLNPAGELCITGTFAATIAFPTIGAAVPATGIYNGINVAGTLRGWSGIATGALYSGSVAIVDASGNQVTSFGGSNASVSATGAAVPASAAYTGINIGGNLTGAVGGHGTAAGALRVELPTDGNGTLATVAAVTAITNPVTVAQATAASLNATVVGTGTFAVQAAATQSGTWTVQPGNTANTTAWKVDGSAVTQPVSAASLPLPALAATSTLQTSGGQKTQIVDGAGAVIASTSNNLNVQCANCSGSGASAADGASFTAGTSVFAPSGVFYQTTPTDNPLTNGLQGMMQGTAQRAGFVNLRNASGTEIGTSTTPVQVSVTNTGANATAIKVNVASGGIASGAVASGAVASGAYASGALASGSIASGAMVDLVALSSPVAAATATATKSILLGGQYDSTQKTLTNGQQAAISASVRGALIVATGADTFNVVCTSGCSSSGGTSAGDASNFSFGTDQVTPIGGTYQTNPSNNVLTAGTFGVVQLTQQRAMFVNLRSASSDEIGIAATPLQVSLANTGANTNKILVTPDSVALPANQSVNVAQINGVTTLMGNGTTGTGSQRVTIASDNTAFAVNATLSAETTKVIGTVNQGTSPWVVSGTVTAANASVAATGAAVPASATYIGVNVGGNLTGWAGAVTVASGGIASGAVASGAIASGAYASGSIGSGAVASGAYASGALASGSIASGAMVDLVALSTPIAAATATATKGILLGGQYDSTQKTLTTGQQGGVSLSARGAVMVAVGADGFAVTASNLSTNIAQVGGTNTLSAGVAGAMPVGGTVATNVAITANPLNLGAQAVSSENAAVTTARQVQLVADLVGKLIVLPYSNPENFVSGVITSAMTSTTSTSLVAAPAAGLRNYLTACTFSNAHATVGTDIVIQDGSGGTTLWTAPAAAVYGGAHLTFPTPLRQPTTATAIYVANVTTGASTKAACSGYKGA